MEMIIHFQTIVFEKSKGLVIFS